MDTIATNAGAYEHGASDAAYDFHHVGTDYALELVAHADCGDGFARVRLPLMIDVFERENGPDFFAGAVENAADRDIEGEARRHYAQGYTSRYFALIREYATWNAYDVDADVHAAALDDDRARARVEARGGVLPDPP